MIAVVIIGGVAVIEINCFLNKKKCRLEIFSRSFYNIISLKFKRAIIIDNNVEDEGFGGNRDDHWCL